ncbi:MAG: hypothetical protein D4R44_01245 [Actinobacteria bacterium]|nr:MAG: hypothetical protein D4R44_01245 [Actinomycetota bacterium]
MTKICENKLFAPLYGFVVGAILLGPRNVLPWNLNWLVGKGDGSADQLVFQFFRQTPFLQWPMTAIPNYVAGANTVNPSGNTIFGVTGKFVGLFVPGQFQYFGVLIVLWFALQAFFAERLLSRFISNGMFRIIGATFFVISPAFLYRLAAMRHFHVSAHWLIIAALYLYFDERSRTKSWAILISVAVAINLYIAISVVMIFIASIIKIYIRNEPLSLSLRLKFCIKVVVPSILSAIGSFVVSGFMSYKESSGGTGFYRLNLLAFFNPGYSATGSFSNVLDLIVPTSRRLLFSEEWEGFQYLGIGVIVSLPLVALYFWRHRRDIRNSSWLPLLCALVVLFLIALSNRVTFAHIEVHYWWPDVLLRFREIFRGAPRFGFALYYLLTLMTIVTISRIFSKKYATIFLGVLLVLTLVDQAPGILAMHRSIGETTSSKALLIDNNWSLVAKNHSKLIIDKNFDLQVKGQVTSDAITFANNWFELAQFAVDHHMSTNFGYVSRPIEAFVKAEDARVARELSSGQLDSDAVYLVSNKADWIMYREHMGNKGHAYELDGFFVIASK